MKQKVYKATAYNPMETGSLGKADNMLIRQFNFPYEYERGVDVMTGADSDRLMGWDYDGFSKTLKDHIHTGELGIGSWCFGASDEEIMNFIKEALNVEKNYPEVEFTGYRVTVTVNRSNGFQIYNLTLFANKSGAKVYSDACAPNVENGGGMCFVIRGDNIEGWPQIFSTKEEKFYDRFDKNGGKRKVNK